MRLLRQAKKRSCLSELGIPRSIEKHRCLKNIFGCRLNLSYNSNERVPCTCSKYVHVGPEGDGSALGWPMRQSLVCICVGTRWRLFLGFYHPECGRMRCATQDKLKQNHASVHTDTATHIGKSKSNWCHCLLSTCGHPFT